MNIYLIERNGKTGYDEYDSAVVFAESEYKARMTHPSSGPDWNGEVRTYDSWVKPEDVNVTLLGSTSENELPSVICASYNAG